MLEGLYVGRGDDFLAKIAAAGKFLSRVLARGDGWTVSDVVCQSGPDDRPFEERHSNFSIAVVAAGTFEYRSAAGRALMTPGSLMLGSAGQSFECRHEHAVGDRCVAFWYAPAYFERLAADAGAREARFGAMRVPPLRALSPLVARACAALDGSLGVSWEELGVRLAAHAVQLSGGLAPAANAAPPGAVARVSQAVRRIEREPEDGLSLATLARAARLSPYHFLRTFERITGVTPHQYVLRARLRRAATRLATEPGKVLDLALESGFGDLSNFNRAFRAEFGMSPRAYRRHAG
jgi:AraC family transcriptional regulator